MNIINKLKNLKKLFSYFNWNSEEGEKLNSSRDWGLVILWSIIFLAIAVVLDGYILFRVRGDASKGLNVGEVKITMMKEKNLKEALDFLWHKEEEYKNALQLPTPKDPSI